MFESKLTEDTNKVYNYILDLIEKNPDYTNINGSAWMGLPGYITFYGYDIQRATISLDGDKLTLTQGGDEYLPIFSKADEESKKLVTRFIKVAHWLTEYKADAATKYLVRILSNLNHE